MDLLFNEAWWANNYSWVKYVQWKHIFYVNIIVSSIISYFIICTILMKLYTNREKKPMGKFIVENILILSIFIFSITISVVLINLLPDPTLHLKNFPHKFVIYPTLTKNNNLKILTLLPNARIVNSVPQKKDIIFKMFVNDFDTDVNKGISYYAVKDWNHIEVAKIFRDGKTQKHKTHDGAMIPISNKFTSYILYIDRNNKTIKIISEDKYVCKIFKNKENYVIKDYYRNQFGKIIQNNDSSYSIVLLENQIIIENWAVGCAASLLIGLNEIQKIKEIKEIEEQKEKDKKEETNK